LTQPLGHISQSQNGRIYRVLENWSFENNGENNGGVRPTHLTRAVPSRATDEGKNYTFYRIPFFVKRVGLTSCFSLNIA
jgi:hypothetical protein